MRTGICRQLGMYMFSVFSNKLIKSGTIKVNSTMKPSDIMMAYANSGNVLFNYSLFTGTSAEDEPLYILRPGALKFLNWVNKNILCKIMIDDSRTMNVKLRIATGMLNKLENQGVIPKEYCILYHMRMVDTIKSIHTEIMLEDLPF